MWGRGAGQINIRIEELRLHGLSPGEADRFVQALEAELGRLLSEGGAPRGMQLQQELDYLDAGTIVRTPGASAASLGAQVARNLYGGMDRESGPTERKSGR